MVGRELRVAEAEPLHDAGPHAFDHDVGLRDQRASDGHAFGGLEVQAQPELVAVEGVEQRAVVADPRRAERASEFALGRLDLDHAGAHVGQQHRAGGPGADLREVDDLQALECSAQHGDVSFMVQFGWRLKAPWAVAMTVPSSATSSALAK